MDLLNLSDTGWKLVFQISVFLNILFIACLVFYLIKKRVTVKQQTNYRDFFANSNDAMLILDADHRFIEVNDKTVELFGYSREELLKLSVMDIIPAEQIERSAQEFERLNKEGHYEKFTGRIFTRNGQVRHIEVSSSAIYREGKIVGSRDIVRDITARVKAGEKQAELIDQLKKSQAEVKTLQGILPICLYCKKVRDDKGYWEQIDVYIKEHSHADISHGICPDCLKTHFPDKGKLSDRKRE